MSTIPNTDPFFVPLKRGETYTLDDVHGMVCFDAKLRGALEDENYGANGRERVFLFERIGDGDVGSRYIGAVAKAYVDEGGISVRLVAHYYGDTLRTLKAWNYTEPKGPKWARLK